MLSVMLGWNLPRHRAGDRAADGRLHDVRRRAGGDLDRRQADGRHRRRRSLAAVVVLIFGLPADVSARRRAAHRRLHRPAARRSISASTSPSTYTFWSGMIGGLFLMLSYFGCDQSQVQRYLTAKSVDEGALVAADERLREDSAAGADAAHRRARVHVLPVRAAADAVQPRARDARCGPAPQAAEYAALEARVRRRVRRAPRRGGARCAAAGGDDRGERRVRATRSAADARMPTCARQAVASSSDVDRRRSYTDVNYVFPTFVTTQHADGPRRPDDRGDLRGGDVGDRRRSSTRSSTATLDRLLSAACSSRTATDAPLPAACRGWRPPFWGLFACVVAI